MLGTHFTPFPYSPTETLEGAATRLNEAITAAEASGQPVHIVAHGTGCRVALAADAAAGAGRTRSMGQRVLLSPPLAGNATARARAEGRDALTTALTLVSGGDQAQIATRLEERLQLGSAEALAEPLPETLEPMSAWAKYAAIFGRAASTWTTDPASGELRFTDLGDGHVPLTTPPLELAAHYLWVPFDRLVTDERALGLIMQLLAGTPVAPSVRAPDAAALKRARITTAPESVPGAVPHGGRPGVGLHGCPGGSRT